jgi:hypothetical protein
VPLPIDRSQQHQRSQVRRFRQVQAAIDRQALEAGDDRLAACIPNRAGDKRAARLDAAVEHEVLVLGLPARHGVRIRRHRQDFLLVHKQVEGGIGRPDRFLGEWLQLGRRGIHPQHRPRITSLGRVVDQDRQQSPSVGACVEMMIESGLSWAAVAVSTASYSSDLGAFYLTHLVVNE